MWIKDVSSQKAWWKAAEDAMTLRERRLKMEGIVFGSIGPIGKPRLIRQRSNMEMPAEKSRTILVALF